MSPVESSLALFKRICQIVELRIDEHFKKIDENNNKSNNENVLRITELADSIASELEIKSPESLYSIHLYLSQRPDLEVRSGKNGGICRVGDDRNKPAMTPKECGLKFYESVKECAPAIIEHTFNVAEESLKAQGLFTTKVRLNFQDLCTEIGNKLNIKSYAVYHCLRQYIQDERKDLIVALGRGGGLMKK